MHRNFKNSRQLNVYSRICGGVTESRCQVYSNIEPMKNGRCDLRAELPVLQNEHVWKHNNPEFDFGVNGISKLVATRCKISIIPCPILNPSKDHGCMFVLAIFCRSECHQQ
jgi:hypothetical protein